MEPVERQTRFEKNCVNHSNPLSLELLEDRALPSTTISLSQTGIASGTTGFGYNQVFSVSSATGQVDFASENALPPGLSLKSTGLSTAILTGVPTLAGSYSITLDASDSAGQKTSHTYNIVIGQSTSSTPVLFASGTDNGGGVPLLLDSGKLSLGTPSTLIPGNQIVHTVTADMNGDGIPDYIVVTGPGIINQLEIIDGKTQKVLASFSPFELTYTGGLFVAAGDINGDGVPDIVVSPDQSGGGVVAVYDGAKAAQGLGNNFAFGQTVQINRFLGIADPSFRGGARVAVGDLAGDGTADIIVAAGTGGGPRIAIFNGSTIASTPQRLVPDFFAYENALRNGAYVAVGDFAGDGKGDLIFGAGPGGSSRVRIINSAAFLKADSSGTISLDSPPAGVILNDFIAVFGTNSPEGGRGGVTVAAASAFGTNKIDLILGSGQEDFANITIYNNSSVTSDVKDLQPGGAFFAGPPNESLNPFNSEILPNGVFVG